MKCQALNPHPDGTTTACPNEADYALLMTRWEDGGKRLYVCAAHRLPKEAYRSIYYIGRGAMGGKVVPIEAARARRHRAQAR